MSLQNLILIVIAVVVIFLAVDSVYTVHQTERAVLLRPRRFKRGRRPNSAETGL